MNCCYAPVWLLQFQFAVQWLCLVMHQLLAGFEFSQLLGPATLGAGCSSYHFTASCGHHASKYLDADSSAVVHHEGTISRLGVQGLPAW